MEIPLVTIICICYQHEKFIKKALESVFLQTYPRLQILITDDNSQDNSVKIIDKFIQEKKLYTEILDTNFEREISFFSFEKERIGNCKRFNLLLAKAKGKYIIDFATDDVFLPEKIKEQVEFFEKQPEKVGVVFTNCVNINEQGDILSYHFKIDNNQKTTELIPEGDIFSAILRKYFISTPTMMMRKSVLDFLEGYDENLSYEDFDFWVRSSQICDYKYLDVVSTLKRDVKSSHSKQFYQLNQNQHLISTLKVCEKASQFIQKKSEVFGLKNCLLYHQKQCFFTHNFDLFFEYEKLLERLYGQSKSIKRKIFIYLAKNKIKLFQFYKLYIFWRFKKKI